MAVFNHYYVNDDPLVISGDHEVHRNTCLSLALARSKTYLGFYADCKDAIEKAKTIYAKVDRCAYCCQEDNKS